MAIPSQSLSSSTQPGPPRPKPNCDKSSFHPRSTFESAQPTRQDTTFSELPPSQATTPPTSSRNPYAHSYPHPHTYPPQPQRGDTTSAHEPTQSPEAEAESEPHRFAMSGGPNGIAFPISTEPRTRPRRRDEDKGRRNDEFFLPRAMGIEKGAEEVGFERDSRWLNEMRASHVRLPHPFIVTSNE
jgi:hypothetical protein